MNEFCQFSYVWETIYNCLLTKKLFESSTNVHSNCTFSLNLFDVINESMKRAKHHSASQAENE